MIATLNNPIFYKSIFQGRLEFGAGKNIEKSLQMYQIRSEQYYRNEIMFKPEQIFFMDQGYIDIPRLVTQSTEKTFTNTLNLLEYIAQFASAGSLGAWLIDSGKILRHKMIEPQSDKVAVQEYLKGRKLIGTKGKEKEAIQALDLAILKYEKHSQAYERRGYVNFTLKNYRDAMSDFNKSIQFDENNALAYFGRAQVYLYENKIDLALLDLALTIQKSLALQMVHWQARFQKGELQYTLKQYKEASFELKLFCDRKFDPKDISYLKKRDANYIYGKILMEQEQFDEAAQRFNAALAALEEEPKAAKFSKADILLQRGLAKKLAGKNGFMADVKEAATLGNKEAKKMLQPKA
ncbi:MAG: tetratricopeptide repeat protein [Saprospiraceae bacterium]|nr:tetratricopeptide repeat protein [Saprospiraceae bacterium]